MGDGITQGVFQLSDPSRFGMEGVRYWRDWLKAHCVRIRRDPTLWRGDVLEFAHERGWLHDGTSFAVLLARLYMRLRTMDDIRRAGAANDSDLYGPHPEHWTLESFRTWRAQPLQAGNFPKLVCSPFARMTRVRHWSHAELVANLNPKPRSVDGA